MKWSELTEQQRTDLLEWFNVTHPDSADKRRLAALVADGRFWAWDCPMCDDRCYYADPAEWGHFQGARQNDYASYPGNSEVYTDNARIAMCDKCRMKCVHRMPEPAELPACVYD